MAAGSSGAPGGQPPTRLASLKVVVFSDDDILTLGTNESYVIEIVPGGEETSAAGGEGSVDARAVLTAATVFGAIHGLETFSQLTTRSGGTAGCTGGGITAKAAHRAFAGAAALVANGGPIAQASTAPPATEVAVYINSTKVTITDAPRFKWRGLMIDTARHFHPRSSIETMLDGMAFNKLNVLHWHITDAQSFPLKTSAFPKLVAGAYGGAGSTLHYTSDDVKRVVAYAKDRAIRVVPEIDSPGW
jgi:hexosaminidase